MTLEKFGYNPSLIVDSDYLIGVLQTNIKGKKGFIEIRQEEAIPIYKIEDDQIKSIAVLGVDHTLMEEILARVSREDILASFASLTKSKPPLKVAFYNKNQPLEKMLRFYDLKEPVSIDDKLFSDLIKHMS